MTDIRQTFSGKNLFCTGVTGFLGKVLLFKVLKEFPDVGTVYCLCRPKKNVTMQQRFEKEVLSSPCFDPLIKQIGQEEWSRRKAKCVAVGGDITFHRLGISAEEYQTLTQRVHIILHLAATVDFNEKLNLSVNMNVLGAVRVLSLAQRCEHLEALVHTSTCYVNFPRHDGAPILEQLYPVDYDPESMAKYIMALHDNQIPAESAKLLTRYGYPNTYTFTKNLAEQILVKRRGSVPMAIVRPSIVGAAWREPVQGWVDALTAAGGIFLTVGLGVCHDLVGNIYNSPDIIPVDFIVNILLKVAHRTSLQHKASLDALAHAGSASRIATGKEISTAAAVAAKGTAAPQPIDVLTPSTSPANPLLVSARDGSSDTAFDADIANPVRVYQGATSGTMNPCVWKTLELSLIPYWREMKHPKAASPPYFTFHKTLLGFEAAFFFKHRLPLAIMQTVNRVPGLHSAKRAQLYTRYEKALARTRDLNQQFAPFTVNQWKFDCTNADTLDSFLAPENKVAFGHDVFDINWYHYGVAYSWGLIRFIMKEDRPQPIGPPSGSEVVLKAFL